MILFNSLPGNLRTPGTFIEFDSTLAGATSQNFKMLALGQKLPAGTQPALVPVLITRTDQADNYFGQGSMLAAIVKHMLATNDTIELHALPLDDAGGGIAATGKIQVASSAPQSGVIHVYIAATHIPVTVTAGDSQNAIATNIATAITGNADLPVTAAVNGVNNNEVDLTAKNTGQGGNGIDLRFNYYGEPTPAGLTLTIVDMGGGDISPDISNAIAAIGDEQYNWIVCPYTDSGNLTTLETELDGRWGPTNQNDSRVFIGYRDTLAGTSTFGNARNNPHVTCIGTSQAPQPPYIWAAINCAAAAASLSTDPARPLQTLALPGILPPALADRWTRTERNTLLFDGIATYTVAHDGAVRIERQITMYQSNAAGQPDAAYLDINTPETLSRIRYEQRAMFASKYPRHKLAADGTRASAGQAIITPKIARGELLALYRTLEQRGWVEDYHTYKANLVTEIDANDSNRLNYRDTPNLVNQARIFTGKTQFIV